MTDLAERYEEELKKLLLAMSDRIKRLEADLRLAIMSDSQMCKVLEDANIGLAAKVDRLEAENERHVDRIEQLEAALRAIANLNHWDELEGNPLQRIDPVTEAAQEAIETARKALGHD